LTLGSRWPDCGSSRPQHGARGGHAGRSEAPGLRYLDAQARAYDRVGYGPLVEYGRHGATANPIQYLAAFDDDDAPIAGIRIHTRLGGPLPSEIHLRHPGLVRQLDAAAARGTVGEMCGMWVSDAWRGTGLATLVLVAGIAAAASLGIETVCGSCADRQRAFYERCGFAFRLDAPLYDVPLPGITAYYSIMPIDDLIEREGGLGTAVRRLYDALRVRGAAEGDAVRASGRDLDLPLAA
jgi:GNAT superfamily N-acetyltransferase